MSFPLPEYQSNDAPDDSPPTHAYTLTPHLSYNPTHITSLALIKRHPTLDPLSPLSTQLHILNLFDREETPYESLHAVVSSEIKPWFDAFIGTQGGRKDGDSKMGAFPTFRGVFFSHPIEISSIPMTKKKFAELVLSLLHL